MLGDTECVRVSQAIPWTCYEFNHINLSMMIGGGRLAIE